MTESLSFFEEQFSDIPPTRFIDLVAQPTWQDFCDEAKAVEFDVSDYDPNDDDACTEVGRRTNELRGKLDYDYIGRRSKVVGMGYNNYGLSSSASTNKPRYINTDNASFFGVNVCFVNGRWQAMLEFECAKDAPDLPKGTYNIPPDEHHLMTLGIDMSDDMDKDEPEQAAVRALHEDYKSVQKLVQGDDFATAPPEGRRMYLDDICKDAAAEFPRELWDGEIVIACIRYYTDYDHQIPGFNFRNFPTDLSDIPPDERHALNGTVTAFEYPELKMLPPDHPLHASTLDMNDGVYCLVLRNDKEQATYYILPQSITEIY